MNRLKFFFKNWKIGVHLLFKTKRFGVNNKWWSDFNSIFGWKNRDIIKGILKIKPVINNYKEMQYRSGACHFMTDKEFKLAFGRSKEEWKKHIKA